MAHLQAPDDQVRERFRQPPPNGRPSSLHPAQQPPGPQASDRHYDRTREAVVANIDTAQAQAAAAHDQSHRPTVTPQGNEPFMVHAAKITPIPAIGSRER